MASPFFTLRKRLEQIGSQISRFAVVEVATIAGLVAVWNQDPNALLPMMGGAALGTIFAKFEKQQPIADEEISHLKDLIRARMFDESDLMRTIESYFRIHSTVISREHLEMVSTILRRVDSHFSRVATQDQLISLIELFNQVIALQKLPSADALHSFCGRQTHLMLRHLSESEIYIPEVYTERKDIETQFSDFVHSSYPCFCLTGTSGVGKTNFLCSLAERLSREEHFTLFYRASRMNKGLFDAIIESFRFEFPVNSLEFATLLNWFSNCVEDSGKTLFIFVDGVDEYPKDYLDLQVELDNLAQAIEGSRVKVCLSCKNVIWNEFEKELGGALSVLGKLTYTPSGDSEKTGVRLSLFSASELEDAFSKYQNRYSLNGGLEGSAQEECHDPFILRLVAETYSGNHIPHALDKLQVLQRFYRYKLERIPLNERRISEHVLIKVAKLLVETNQRRIDFGTIREELNWNSSLEAAYREVVNVGFLIEEVDEFDLRFVSFGFDRIRNYIYVVPGEQWTALRNTIPVHIAQRIAVLVRSFVGFEAVDFFLWQIDHGESSVFTSLAAHDFDAFRTLVSYSRRRAGELSVIIDKEHILLRLRQYAVTYSELRNKYFAQLSTLLAPYELSDVGAWISQEPLNFSLSVGSSPHAIPAGGYIFQFRAVSQAAPDRILELSLQDSIRIYNANLAEVETQELFNRLHPGGVINITFTPFERELPQAAAIEVLETQLRELFRKRTLLVQDNPILLQDRIIGSLIYEPHISAERGLRSFAQLLGLASKEQISTTSVAELIERCYRLMLLYQLKGFRRSDDPDVERYRWIHPQTYQTAKRLLVFLILFEGNHKPIELIQLYDLERRFTPPHLMIEEAVQDMSKFLPPILLAYKKFVDENFAGLARELVLYQHLEEPLLIEITQGNDGWIYVSYIVFLDKNPLDASVVRAVSPTDAVYYRVTRSPSGLRTYRHEWFVNSSVTFPLDRESTQKIPVTVYTTVLSDKYPIFEQVYKLTACEFADKFMVDLGDWRSYTFSTTNDSDSDRWTEAIFEQWTRKRVSTNLEHPIPSDVCYWLECEDRRLIIIEATKVEDSFLLHPPLKFEITSCNALAERLSNGGYIVELTNGENGITLMTAVPPNIGVSSEGFREMIYKHFGSKTT